MNLRWTKLGKDIKNRNNNPEGFYISLLGTSFNFDLDHVDLDGTAHYTAANEINKKDALQIGLGPSQDGDNFVTSYHCYKDGERYILDIWVAIGPNESIAQCKAYISNKRNYGVYN